MNKKIIIQNNPETNGFSEYLDFNGILYEKIDLYQPDLDTNGRYDVPELLQKPGDPTILILDALSLSSILDWKISRQNLLDFLNRKNKVIFFQGMDSGVHINRMAKVISELDSDINAGSIMYISDVKFPPAHWTNRLSNSLIKISPFSWFMKLQRLHRSGTEKSRDSYPYMITTIIKKGSQHRKILYSQLKQNKSLYDKGLCVFHRRRDTENYQGMQPIQHDFYQGYPSMDLYKNAFLEIVPETMYKQGYFSTEKTTKPIATKTPFLAVSSMGYLDYLRSLGFRTFDHLISERYDLEHKIEHRIRLMLEQLDDIVKNGARDFYLSSLDVLEHNQKRLAEITGLWEIQTDEFLTQCLQEVDQ